jgi:alpha-beta hydrolase superfamily lysophospholipase
VTPPGLPGGDAWRPDILEGFESLELTLPGADPAPGEPAGTVVTATLTRRLAPPDPDPVRHRSAVLYVHGWNDYFFQTHLAAHLIDLGFDFYALDLRRYGRSLRPGQLPGFITDLRDYRMELDLAADLIATDHESIVAMGHSTGGLVAALWAAEPTDPEHEGRRRISALVLNAPWLDLQGSSTMRMLGGPAIDRLGTFAPTRVLRLPELGFYARTLHATLEGEWSYDLALKSTPGPPIRAGWLRAILQGHQRVAAGLGLTVPVLVMCSSATDFSRRWHEGLRQADTVLDVEQIVARAVRLGRLVTIVRIEHGLHDVFLSPPDIRKAALEELSRWLRAYGPGSL